MFAFKFINRLDQLEIKLRDPSNVANIDSLLDTVTALIADFDHDTMKRIKNVEAYTNRCKILIFQYYILWSIFSFNSNLSILNFFFIIFR